MNEQLANEAVAALRTRLIETPYGEPTYSKLFTTNFHSGEGECERILRMDFEQVGDVSQTDKSLMVDDLLNQLRFDINDLLENGDTEHPNDPLLKAMDGAKKLDKRLALVDFPVVQVLPEYHWRKDTTEITMYLRIYVQWT